MKRVIRMYTQSILPALGPWKVKMTLEFSIKSIPFKAIPTSTSSNEISES